MIVLNVLKVLKSATVKRQMTGGKFSQLSGRVQSVKKRKKTVTEHCFS